MIIKKFLSLPKYAIFHSIEFYLYKNIPNAISYCTLFYKWINCFYRFRNNKKLFYCWICRSWFICVLYFFVNRLFCSFILFTYSAKIIINNIVPRNIIFLIYILKYNNSWWVIFQYYRYRYAPKLKRYNTEVWSAI